MNDALGDPGGGWRTAAVVVVALGLVGGLTAVGWWAGSPFGSLPADHGGGWDDLSSLFGPEGAALPVTDARTAAECAAACAHVVECGLVPETELCESWCVDDWSARTRSCAAAAECGEIESRCFERTDEQACDAACDAAAGCAWMTISPAECRELCLGEWTDRERECVERSDCEDAADHCLNLTTRTPCPVVCDKLAECGAIGEGDFRPCIQMCELDMDESMRECLTAYDCEEIDAVCVEGELPEEMCGEACGMLDDCGMIESADEECLMTCAEVWDEELALCLVDVDVCADAAECFADPGIQCSELCGLLADCGEIDALQVDACDASCLEDFTEEERACMMAADCATVNDCLLPPTVEPSPECASACAKMAECGALNLDGVPNCADTCADWPDGRAQCVLDAVCESMAVDCLGG